MEKLSEWNLELKSGTDHELCKWFLEYSNMINDIGLTLTPNQCMKFHGRMQGILLELGRRHGPYRYKRGGDL